MVFLAFLWITIFQILLTSSIIQGISSAFIMLLSFGASQQFYVLVLEIKYFSNLQNFFLFFPLYILSTDIIIILTQFKTQAKGLFEQVSKRINYMMRRSIKVVLYNFIMLTSMFAIILGFGQLMLPLYAFFVHVVCLMFYNVLGLMVIMPAVAVWDFYKMKDSCVSFDISFNNLSLFKVLVERTPKLVLEHSKKIVVVFIVLVVLFCQPVMVLLATFESIACIGTVPKAFSELSFSDSNYIEVSIYAGVSGYNEKFFDPAGINPWLP